MIYVYKVEPFDNVEGFNVFTMLRLLSENKVLVFEYLDARKFWDLELLAFKDGEEEGAFIILDDETGVIKRMRLEFGLDISDEIIISEK